MPLRELFRFIGITWFFLIISSNYKLRTFPTPPQLSPFPSFSTYLCRVTFAVHGMLRAPGIDGPPVKMELLQSIVVFQGSSLDHWNDTSNNYRGQFFKPCKMEGKADSVGETSIWTILSGTHSVIYKCL